MNLIDKLLLGSLILLLPIGLGISFFLVKPPDLTTEPSVTETQIDTQKLQTLIQETVKNSQPVVATPRPIAITEVSFASASATLTLKGTAPAQTASVYMSATVLKRPEDTASIKPEDKVKGVQVQTVSLVPETNGQFTFEYQVNKKNINDIIELRIEQNQSVSTVKFDLREKRQVL